MGGFGVGFGDNGITRVHHVSGFNGAASTSEEGVWGQSAAFNFPSAAVAMEVDSSSVNDDGDPAGTGARTVTVEGLDGNYAEISETITTNGTTAVALSNTYLRINRAYVATAGSGNANAGNITVQGDSGGAVYAYMPAGYNETADAKFTVPAGYTGHIMDLIVTTSAPSSATVDILLKIREQGGLFLTTDVHRVGLSAFEAVYHFPIIVPAKADVIVNCIGSAAADVSVAFDIGLEKN